MEEPVLNAHIERKKSKCDYDACAFEDGRWRVRWKVQ